MKYQAGDLVQILEGPHRDRLLRIRSSHDVDQLYMVEMEGEGAKRLQMHEEDALRYTALYVPPPDPDVKHMVDEYLRETA